MHWFFPLFYNEYFYCYKLEIVNRNGKGLTFSWNIWFYNFNEPEFWTIRTKETARRLQNPF